MSDFTFINNPTGTAPNAYLTKPFQPKLTSIPQTTKAALTFPQGEHIFLHKIQMFGNGTHWGGLGIIYNSVAQAQFPIAAAATWSYSLNYRIPGVTFPNANLITQGSTPQQWNYIAGDAPNPNGPPIEWYKGDLTTLQAATNTGIALSGAVALTAGVTFDVGPGYPRAVVPFTVASSITEFVLPAIGGWQFGAMCVLETQVDPPDFVQCPRLPGVNTLTPLYTSTGTGNFGAVVYYTTGE